MTHHREEEYDDNRNERDGQNQERRSQNSYNDQDSYNDQNRGNNDDRRGGRDGEREHERHQGREHEREQERGYGRSNDNDEFRDNDNQNQGQEQQQPEKHKGSLMHEVIAGFAGYEGEKKWDESRGNAPGHFKPLVAAFAAAEADKFAETKGRDWVDREEAQRENRHHGHNRDD